MIAPKPTCALAVAPYRQQVDVEAADVAYGGKRQLGVDGTPLIRNRSRPPRVSG
jgi:hypothetical protein